MGCSQLGKCVKYMSLLQGEFSNFNVLLCSNLTINENGYCVVSRLNQTTTECDDEQNVCEYFYDDGVNETNHTKNCSCSRGDGNKRYCPLDTVNEEFTKTRWKIDSIIFENRNKHTMNRLKVDYEDERQLMYVFKYPRYTHSSNN